MNHVFDSEEAIRYGLNEAIIIQEIRGWIRYNKANEKNFYEGKYWTYNSKKAWSKLLPFFTERQVKYALEHLREMGVLEVGNFNESAYDKTLWYTFADQSMLKMGDSDNAELSNPSDKIVQGPSDKIVQSTNIIKHNYNNIGKTAKKADGRLKFGKFSNVLLTQSEYDTLATLFTKEVLDKKIEDMSWYCSQNKKTYKDYSLAIQNWFRKEGVTPQEKKETPIYKKLHEVCRNPECSNFGVFKKYTSRWCEVCFTELSKEEKK